MHITFMSQTTQAVVLGVIVAAALGVLGYGVWNQLSSTEAADGGPMTLNVLCARCGYFGQAEAASLQVRDGTRAARNPAFGPGNICFKCGQATLYANPHICSGCQTPFLPDEEDARRMRATCPKCKKVH